MIKLRINPLPSTTYQKALAPLRQRLSTSLKFRRTNRRVKVVSPAFTIVELIIVITIMAILMTLGVVNLRGSQANANDTERKTDIESIAQHLETYYTSGTDSLGTPPPDCTGGAVSHDGAYTVNKFTTGGTLDCTSTGTVSTTILVVGGGGGGGGANAGNGGGGGAGGVVTGSVALNGSMSVTVGNGGNAGTTGTGTGGTIGGNGGNSIFGSLTAIGGGGGGQYSRGPAGDGGSGGGGGQYSNPDYGNGIGTSGQGYDGGTHTGTGYGAGGGGGAGAVGGNGRTGANYVDGGYGGVGATSSITGTATYYGGGGGGSSHATATGANGAGGNGGGGNGAWDSNIVATVGTNGLGGGGGGGGGGMAASVGGSGVVIIRYLKPITNIHSVSYPSTALTTNITILSVRVFLPDINADSITAPGTTDPATTFISASDGTILTNVSAHPTTNEYVYQPLHKDGTLCNDTAECTKFNLYYRSEADNTVYMVTSKNQ